MPTVAGPSRAAPGGPDGRGGRVGRVGWAGRPSLFSSTLLPSFFIIISRDLSSVAPDLVCKRLGAYQQHDFLYNITSIYTWLICL